MPRGKLLWRARKGSLADPILTKACGCKYWCHDGTVVRPCPEHDPMKGKRETAEKEGK